MGQCRGSGVMTRLERVGYASSESTVKDETYRVGFSSNGGLLPDVAHPGHRHRRRDRFLEGGSDHSRH